MNTELLEKFKSTILSKKKPSKITADGKEIWCRCPYCGDSTKHTNHGHFYIKADAPFKYYCQKCTEHGAFNNDVLRDLGLDTPELFIMLAELNAEYRNSDHYVPPVEKRQLILREYNSILSRQNLQYINDRFKLNMDENYVRETYNIILDVPQFFQDNNIVTQMNFGFAESIGILSNDKSHISFRDTSNTNPLRYIILTLNEIGTKTCIVRAPLDVMSPVINVHLAEGMMDIIGIREFLVDKDATNHIFVAACGKSYLRAIKTIIHRGFLNLNIHIYSDSDVPPTFFDYLKRENIEFTINPVNLYYNDVSKDFGVPKEQIKLRRGVI